MTISLKFSLALAASATVGCAQDANDDCDTPGTTCVWAGVGERGYNIDNPNAHRLASKLYFPEDLTFGPDGRAYIVDFNNHRIRRVEANDSLRDVVGTDYEGDGAPRSEDLLPLCNAFGAPGTSVSLNHPSDAEFGPDGKLYFAAWHNNKIRVFDPATDVVTTLAGNGYGFAGDNGPSCGALFNQPKAVTVGPDGTVYTIDQRNVRIRAIQPDTGRTIATIAGTGIKGEAGDGGQALDAEFGFDTGTTPQPSGSLVLDGNFMYVADSLNNRIRRINQETGIIDCIAGGSATPGYSGDGGQALAATFQFPIDMELGPDGRLYIVDRYNHVIRAMDLTTGIIDTVAGTGTRCDVSKDTCADGLLARETGLNEPYGIAFDGTGNLYIADTENHRILRVAR